MSATLIPVAFALNFPDRGWMGGINYFRNLLQAVHDLPGRRIEPVVYHGHAANRDILAGFRAPQRFSVWCDSGDLRWKLRRATAIWGGRDVAFEAVLRRDGVRLLSHSGYLGCFASVPAMPWIPDFQERFLPEFFTATELVAREREVKRICRHAQAIVLSSHDALAHLDAFDTSASCRAHVLRFVASVASRDDVPDAATLRGRYQLPERYFFLPNQFWAHKNHEVVLRALALLKSYGIKVVVTGNTRDHRQPGHFEKLMALATDLGVAHDFIVLGSVPYLDLMGLFHACVAGINPSLFEGWSTTVEEARSMGKRMLLADIPVHREQNPPGSLFFDPRDPQELAEVMRVAWRHEDVEHDEALYVAAKESLPARMSGFARDYQNIILRVLGEG